MATTIGSGSRPSVVSTPSSVTRASTSSAATAAPTVSDTFSNADGASGPLGRKTVSQSAAEIGGMSADALKKFEPAEIMGMTRQQFDAFTGAAPFEDLSKDQKRAVLRKTILRSLLDYLVNDMASHQKIGE